MISEFAEGQREECLLIAKKKGIDEVLEFHDILKHPPKKVNKPQSNPENEDMEGIY